MDNTKVSTSELKAHCSQVIDRVVRSCVPVIITRRGRPVAKLVPLEEEPVELFGFLKGSITVHGDVVEPVDVTWEAGE